MNETLEIFYEFIEKPETDKLIDKIDKITDDALNGTVLAALIHTLISTHLACLEDDNGDIDRALANQFLVELSQTLRIVQDNFFDEEES